MADTDARVPDACKLPTADRPLWFAEFDALFQQAVRWTRSQATRLDLVLPRAIEELACDLARRESECCPSPLAATRQATTW